MSWLRKLLTGADSDVIEHWSEARAKQFEAKTYRYLGIRPEPVFTWSRKFRPKGKSNVIAMAKRKAS